MIKNIGNYKPNIAIPPGESLKDILKSINMEQKELSIRTGMSKKTINQIIKGIAPITAETSLKLENVLGIPASFWNNLEKNYQEAKARLKVESKIKDEENIARLIPYSELVKQGHIQAANNIKEKVKNLVFIH